MEQVISIALNDDLILRLADILEEEFIRQGVPLEKAAVIFGGKRPALFLRKELGRRFNNVYFPPAFFSMDEFIKEVVWRKCPARMIRSMDSAFHIFELAKSAHKGLLAERDSFAAFLPWAEEIGAFIEQLDLEEVDDDKLRQIEESAEIGFDTPKEVNLLLQDIVKLRKEFHRALKKEGSLTRGMLYMSAAEYAKDVNLDDFKAIIFCGFFYLHKTEQRMIKSLLNRGKARILFQGDESEWDVLKNLSGVFLKPIKASAPLKKKEPPQIKFYRGFDTHSQAGILRERLKEIKNPEDTLILLANPDALMPLLLEISSLGFDFNVSIGYPLKRSSVYSLFQDIFSAQLSRKLEGGGGQPNSRSHKPEGSAAASDCRSRKGNSYYSRDYLKVLSHPFLKNMEIISASVSRVVTHKAEEILTGAIRNELAGKIFIRMDEIIGLRVLLEETQDTLKHMGIKAGLGDIAGTFTELNKLAFGIWEDVGNFYEFSNAAEKLIMALFEKSPLEKYAPNLKAAQEIMELLAELRSGRFCRQEFSQDEMFKIFTSQLENKTISFSGSPLKGLQILGLLESRSLTFKNVIAMDVNESVLPKLRIYEPLIPRDVMVSLGIDRLEKEEEIQRYQFVRLISAAEKAHLIYRQDQETIRSRFLEDLIWKEEQKQGKVGVVEIPLYGFNIQPFTKKAFVRKNKSLVEFLRKQEFSASSVNMYITCPLKFYFHYCLGLEEKEDLFDEPEARDVGTFTHKLLNEAFTGFLNKKPVINAGFKELFFTEFDELFRKEFGRKMKADSFILEDILRRRMNKFLEKEKERAGIDAVVMLEKKIPWKINSQAGIFYFTAGLDRVDRLSCGSLLVIDYKTGSSEMPKASLESLKLSREEIKNSVKSFQLPIYIWAAREYFKKQDVWAALYYLRTSEMKEYLEKSSPKKREENLNVCHKALSFILDEIVSPDVDFAADDEDAERKCAYCPYISLCG